MKGLIKLSFLVVAMLVGTTVNAGTENSNEDKKSSTTNVTFKNVKRGATLIIKDINGIVLYKEVIKKEGDYKKGFDLTALPDGAYFFELNKDVEIQVTPFSVFGSEVIFSKNRTEVIFKPVVRVNESKVYISKTSLENDEDLGIKIYHKGEELIVNDEIKDNGTTVGRVYDFSTSEKGKYTIVMTSNGKKFTKQITM